MAEFRYTNRNKPEPKPVSKLSLALAIYLAVALSGAAFGLLKRADRWEYCVDKVASIECSDLHGSRF
jgi:hypothetical protein